MTSIKKLYFMLSSSNLVNLFILLKIVINLETILINDGEYSRILSYLIQNYLLSL